MMTENDVQVCAVLRHFKSDVQYLAFEEEFWIEELDERGRAKLTGELRHFNNYPYDKHLVCRWYYAGSRKRFSVLQDNTFAFFRPLFITMKLFKSGHLLMPLCFYYHQKNGETWHFTVRKIMELGMA